MNNCSRTASKSSSKPIHATFPTVVSPLSAITYTASVKTATTYFTPAANCSVINENTNVSTLRMRTVASNRLKRQQLQLVTLTAPINYSTSSYLSRLGPVVQAITACQSRRKSLSLSRSQRRPIVVWNEK